MVDVSQLTIGVGWRGEDLYRLLGVPVGFAVALGCRELIESLERVCNLSDAAYEQDCFSISKCILGGVFWLVGPRLTARENHPDEVHEEVVSPEV
jgi:hypothetical protein